MSAHHQSSGPRSNAYSESKFTNWTNYDPFWAEALAAFKRFDGRLSRYPAFPHVVTLPPLAPDFIHAAKRPEVIQRLRRMPSEHLEELRIVFLLGGSRKQERSWRTSLGAYGFYWRRCVFLCAHTYQLGRWDLDSLRQFYLDDVLVHEVAHHVDRDRVAPTDTREGFANSFVQQKLA
jgi:hypothetical protein